MLEKILRIEMKGGEYGGGGWGNKIRLGIQDNKLKN